MKHFKPRKKKTSLLYADAETPDYKSYELKQPALDLFGGVVVTHDDMFQWVAAVAPVWLSPERSYRNYLRGYNVADKVASAKVTGAWESTIAEAERKQTWHERLGIVKIKT